MKNQKQNERVREWYEGEIIRLGSKLEDLRCISVKQMDILRDFKNQTTSHERLIQRLSSELEKSKEELAQKNRELAILGAQVKGVKERVEGTISFQLGNALIRSTKSIHDFFALPRTLYRLAALSRQRKNGCGVINQLVAVKDVIPPKREGKVQEGQKIRFISILDEISHVSFDGEFRLFELKKNNFEEQIKGSTALGLFIESCWKGNFGKWEYAFTSPGLKHQNAQNLLRALEVAKARNFPIVFWNKEDPMHYEKFLPIASKCSVIFTTDVNKVEDYRRDVPGVKVDTLMFAANIKLCNPVNRFTKEAESVCFAGSYYGVGHEDRKRQMDALLPTIIEYGGAIYDRMSQLGNERYAYPSEYRDFIRPAVPFKEIVSVYKKFKIFLNVNTITDSPTMMSRRVYELLACGTPVISTPSLAIEEQFKGIVQVAKDAQEANIIAKRLLENEWEWLRVSHLGYREVMLKHTYEHRAIQIANALGQKISAKTPLASIIIASNRPHFIGRIVNNVSCQVYPNIEVIVVAQKYTDAQVSELERGLKSSGRKFEAIKIFKNDSEDTLGVRLNQAIALSKGDYVAKFDDDDFYFENYLQDMLIPFKFGDYGVVGKKEIFVYLESVDKTFVRFKGVRHVETNFLTGATLVFSRDALKKLSFGDLNRGEDTNILEQARSMNIKMYVADPFNFVVYRSRDVSGHTWKVSDDFFTEKGVYVGEGLAESVARV